MEFKERLKRYRNEKGYTQDVLAKKIFVSRSTVAKWEAGLGMPSDESISAICHALDITKENLFPPNIDIEPLLVEKNVKLKRRTIVSIILSVILAISLILFAVFITVDYREAKQVSKLTPTVNRVYFEKIEELDRVDGGYLLFTNESHKLLVDVEFDARLDFTNFQLSIDGAECFVREIRAEKSVENKTTRTYGVLLKMVDSSVTALEVSSATYSFYDRADENKCKTKECNVMIKPLPIRVSDKKTVAVTLKFNIDEIMTFEVAVGESVKDTIFNVGNQEFLINEYVKNKYPQLKNNVIFDGWEGSDGESIYDRIYDDTTLNAVVRVNGNKDFNVEASNLTSPIFSSELKPIFNFEGQRYDNVSYILQTDSDCVEFTENYAIKPVKPGEATILAEYDLGFYSGECYFKVTVMNTASIRVFGYQKEIWDGVYSSGVNGYYNSETGEIDISEQTEQELIEYFNKQNEDFYTATGYQRRLVELKRISPLEIMPIFETEYKFDDRAIDFSVCVGDSWLGINKENRLTVNKDEDIRFNTTCYTVEEGLKDVDYIAYCVKDGEFIDLKEITSKKGERILYIMVCYKFDSVFHYKTFEVTISIV